MEEQLKETVRELLNESELSSMDKFSILMELANEELVGDI